MVYVLYTIHVGVSLFLILVVLLQQGKGADLSVFGGGGTQAAFGARGAATLLHKLTVGAFVAFILTTILIGFSTGGRGSSSVMSAVATEEAVTEDSTTVPAGSADQGAAGPAASDALDAVEGDSSDAEGDVELE